MKALRFNVTIPQFLAAKSLAMLLGDSVYFKGPGRTIDLADIDEPQIPSSEWVKIKTIYCGFCGSDLNLIRLHDSPTASPFTSFPCVIGHEIVGQIVETGDDIYGFKTGDIVVINPVLGCEARKIDPLCPCCRSGRSSQCMNVAEGDISPGMFTGINNEISGGFAPFLVAHQSQLFKVPDGLSLESAVMTEPVSVALQAVLENMPLDDDKVLIIGAGVIGNLIVQSIRALDCACHISVLEPSAFAADLAIKSGADEILNPAKVFKQTETITGAKIYKPMLGMEIPMGGFNRIFDTVGISKTLNLSLRLLTAMGTLSVVGIGGDVKLDLTPLWLKLQTVKGVYAYGMVTYNNQKQHVFDIALELMNQGKINAHDLVTHKFDIRDYCQMIEVNLNKSRHQAVKTVVAFTN